ncbi:MAG: ATP-binding cassette domain-containing protein [Oscillospiraceae bacterium]
MIILENVSKTFRGSDGDVEACRNVSLHIEKGEIFGIIGFSGAGKSTLIRCINLLERPNTGKVFVDNQELTALSEKELLAARRNIGMIFQQFNLLMQKTALKNICFPLEIAGIPKAECVKRARELLEIVGIPDKENAFPAQLSGGQKQRVAIARALATNPKVLLCDEATSALDPTTTRAILALLKDINKRFGITIVVITHEMSVIEEICSRVAIMDQSEVAEVGRVEDVFVRPKTKIGRKLIFPDGKSTAPFSGGRCLRLVFDGNSSFEPIIANMILECRAQVNILYADTKIIDGKDYGQMVIQLPENEIDQRRLTAFLELKKIHFEEEFIDV